MALEMNSLTANLSALLVRFAAGIHLDGFEDVHAVLGQSEGGQSGGSRTRNHRGGHDRRRR